MKTKMMILLMLLGFTISVQSQEATKYAQGQAIIKFTVAAHAGLTIQSAKGFVQTSKSEINALFAQLRVSKIESLHPFDQNTEIGLRTGMNRTYVVYFQPTIEVENALKTLQTNPAIEIAEPNNLYQFYNIPNDPYYSNQWGLGKIQAPAAWNLSVGSSDVKIAILDIGFKLDHADLSSKFHPTLRRDEVDINLGSYPAWTFYPEEDYTVPDSDPSVPPDATNINQHGTHVAGIAGASTNNGVGVAGVGWNNMLVPVRCGARASNPSTGGNSIIEQDDWIRALDWVRVNNAAKVVNMSFGRSACQGPYTIENDAIQAALNAGIVLVAASGNSAYDPKNPPCVTQVMYPAAYSGVIAVGATTSSDEKASFSNIGPNLSLTAPGLLIYSTYFDGVGNSTYEYNSGTSMASPHVAGLAALILSVNPNLTPYQVQSILNQSADDLGAPGRDDLYGYGRINAYKAITLTLRNYGGSVNGNITIPAGETWTLTPGITWNFTGNYKLRVEGKLIANGSSSSPITFTRSGGQWYGIEFYNGNAGSSISYATIENAQYGVYNYGTNVPISNSTIRNSTTGVYIYGNSSTLSWSRIQNNTYGVSLAQYGDANIQVNNVLRYNSWAVYGDATSVPALGNYPGYNSLYSNDY
ncbi:MAG: S8 family serine peptidase, partial [Ignavibacteriales bacterium]|nr:S8 family serine peptidase [Ignavibacteriales bacterium]